MTSRWTMPRWCAAASASATARARRGSPRRVQALRARGAARGLALEPLHDEEGLAGAGRAVRDVADDARVPELREHLGFAPRSLDLGPRAGVERLDRHERARLAIAGAKHRAHPSGLDVLLDHEAVREDVADLHWLEYTAWARRCDPRASSHQQVIRGRQLREARRLPLLLLQRGRRQPIRVHGARHLPERPPHLAERPPRAGSPAASARARTDPRSPESPPAPAKAALRPHALAPNPGPAGARAETRPAPAAPPAARAGAAAPCGTRPSRLRCRRARPPARGAASAAPRGSPPPRPAPRRAGSRPRRANRRPRCGSSGGAPPRRAPALRGGGSLRAEAPGASCRRRRPARRADECGGRARARCAPGPADLAELNHARDALAVEQSEQVTQRRRGQAPREVHEAAVSRASREGQNLGGQEGESSGSPGRQDASVRHPLLVFPRGLHARRRSRRGRARASTLPATGSRGFRGRAGRAARAASSPA